MQTMDGGDPGMVQGGEKLRLALEAGEPLRIGGEAIRQDLDGHLTLEGGVERLQTTPVPPSPIFSTSR